MEEKHTVTFASKHPHIWGFVEVNASDKWQALARIKMAVEAMMNKLEEEKK